MRDSAFYQQVMYVTVAVRAPRLIANGLLAVLVLSAQNAIKYVACFPICQRVAVAMIVTAARARSLFVAPKD